MLHTVEIDLDGQKITLETGKIAKQANGAVVVRSGDTVVLVSACANEEPKAGAAFFPLTVDYREYTYAAGKFPGGFIKREGRPSEKEILTSRLIDRPIRPLFPEGFMNETQVIAMVLSADPERDPSTLAIVGAGAALAISDIPFHHVLGGVRVGSGERQAGGQSQLRRNARIQDQHRGRGHRRRHRHGGSGRAARHRRGSARRPSSTATSAARRSPPASASWWPRPARRSGNMTPPAVNKELYAHIEKQIRKELTDALDTKKYPKLESYHRVHEAKKKVVEALPEEQQAEANELFDTLKERIFRDEMLKAKRRPDGRAFDEIRNIDCEVGVLPRTHGSALFTRGETQALVTVTLGTKEDEQRIEMFDLTETSKRFMLHYNFPPFSVGEVGFMRGAGPSRDRPWRAGGAIHCRRDSRREEVPLHLRVVSDILESNGSSSMASVCGATLALMDAGVPIAEPIAGIAMGLVLEGKDYAILTDIAGAEDHYGDMDFKVAGSRAGITGLQMDIKVPNVTTKIMKEALAQAKGARLFILDKMVAVIDKPRSEMSQYAPRIYTLQIPTDKIRDLIGPGGKMIRSIVDETGVKIDVEDDGSVKIFAADGESAPNWPSSASPISAPSPKSARPISAKWFGWRNSARSSRSSPAPTACCTSARFRKIGSKPCAMS